LFTRKIGSSYIALLVYVDDIVLESNDLNAISDITQLLNDISMCQRKYALEILEDFGLSAAKQVKFSMEPNAKFSLLDGPLLSDPTSY